MTRFAFYGRVSTEDQQDPESSKTWQVSRSQSLIAAHGGVIVAEYFDIGQSRSLPWKRRPEAARLLDALKDPQRGFDALVIGEPHRAFYGNQFGLTFPVLTHYGVELWVPEVGGRVDPGSEAHDLVMSLFGGLSKGERMRIKMRVRTAMASQAAIEGRFLGGRPPYGYQLADAGPHPNPGKAAVGQRLHRLEVDPVAAPIVGRIFAEYVAGAGIGAIAERLNADGVPSPSGHDPARNRHRQSANGAWGKSAVRAIIGNPKYTGRMTWNRQRRDETLLDVEDVAAGYQTRMAWNDRAEWVWSAEQTHEAIVAAETFAAAERQRALQSHRQAVVTPKRRHAYALSSLLTCGSCGRRMTGQFTHGTNYYRCRFPSEYAGATGRHAKVVTVRENTIVPALDEWLVSVFDPDHIDDTVKAMAAAQEIDEAGAARAESARRKIADCDDRLRKYRGALEAGADPLIVAGWMREVEGERAVAERQLGQSVPAEPMTAEEIRALIGGVQQALEKLANAGPEMKAALYKGLGVTLTYDPETGRTLVESRPCAQDGVGGGT